MILFVKITTKISQIVTLFSHDGKLPDFFINYHIIIFQMYYQNLSLLLEYPKECIDFFFQRVLE